MRIMPDGGVQVQGLPVRALITIAFGLQPHQLVSATEWSREARSDVQAKPAGPATRAQTMAMLQALIIERFGLTFHRERRLLDGFRLVRASDERLGPNIRPSPLDCEKVAATEPKCREARITVDSMKAVGSPMWILFQEVIAVTGAPVDDATGLAGTYDFELVWSNELAPADNRPSFVTALQEQLGLRLERRPVTEEVFVVQSSWNGPVRTEPRWPTISPRFKRNTGEPSRRLSRRRAPFPRRPGTSQGLREWSPAQIAEHLRLAYAVFDAELSGGQRLRLRSSWWIRPVLRLIYLRSILRTGGSPTCGRTARGSAWDRSL